MELSYQNEQLCKTTTALSTATAPPPSTETLCSNSQLDTKRAACVICRVLFRVQSTRTRLQTHVRIFNTCTMHTIHAWRCSKVYNTHTKYTKYMQYATIVHDDRLETWVSWPLHSISLLPSLLVIRVCVQSAWIRMHNSEKYICLFISKVCK